jgi:hypothetical protein
MRMHMVHKSHILTCILYPLLLASQPSARHYTCSGRGCNQGVVPDPSEQTCHNLKPRNYHEMRTNSTRVVLNPLRFVGSNPTFLSRIHSLAASRAPHCVEDTEKVL